MNDTLESLRQELKDPEYSEGYAESFLDSYIATQIKVLREQAGFSQQQLAVALGTKQGVISRIENVNYSKWNVSTLKKLARAFRVRLKVSFETYGSLLSDVESFSRDNLQRTPREADPVLQQDDYVAPDLCALTPTAARRQRRRSHSTVLGYVPTSISSTGVRDLLDSSHNALRTIVYGTEEKPLAQIAAGQWN